MVVGQEGKPEFYRGVPLPEDWERWDLDGQANWMMGVDAAKDRGSSRQAMSRPRTAQDTPADTARAERLSQLDQDMVDAFAAVVRDDPGRALTLVRRMRGRDRALLMFSLSELSRITDNLEDDRKYTLPMGVPDSGDIRDRPHP